MVKVKENLAGQTFGRLTVLYQDEDYLRNDGKREAQWRCRCICGKTKTILQRRLKDGSTTSCGCYRSEAAVEKNKQRKGECVYDLESKEYGIGYTPKGDEFWFDKEDYDLIKDYVWYFNTEGHLRASEYNNGVQHDIMLHRIVMMCPDDMDVDHIIHPTLYEHKVDNRKSNLRIVTRSQNSMNRHIPRNNTSGVKGVSWNKNKNRWEVYIGYNGKQIRLGAFIDKEDAIRVRQNAEEKYYGEYNLVDTKNIKGE